MIHTAPDHCYRAARTGCGCARCVEWRKALAAWRTVRVKAGEVVAIEATFTCEHPNAEVRISKYEQLTLTEANR